MRKWEYKKISLNAAPRRRDDIDLLHDAGDEGWELVAIAANNVAYFKREVMDPPPQRHDRLSVESDGSRCAGTVRRAANGGTASQVKPKYRDPVTGESWSGRGRMATWLKRKLAAGENIEKYLV